MSFFIQDFENCDPSFRHAMCIADSSKGSQKWHIRSTKLLKEYTDAQSGAFNGHKLAWIYFPVLTLTHLDRNFMIETDSSAYSVSAVFIQRMDDKKQSSWE